MDSLSATASPNLQGLQSSEEDKITQQRLNLLLELTNEVISTLDFGALLQAISSSIRRVLQCHGVGVLLPEEDGKHLRMHAFDVQEGPVPQNIAHSVLGSSPGEAFRTGKPVFSKLPISAILPPGIPPPVDLQAVVFLPLTSRNRTLGVLGLGVHKDRPFDDSDMRFLGLVANQIAIAVDNSLAYREIAELKDKLAQEKLYLEEEIRSEADFEGIIGQSSAMRQALQLVETVAQSDSTVLLLGETGTGKELIAQALHDRSRRKDRTLVKLNCAAIPTGLLESELFGHERGAFTGAITQKIGRLELADRGTLFLDEVGDIPLELQPKLLRALQEREFERLGSTSTKRVDVRLVAATNRDLQRMIEEKQFRADLYYRLNVVPIRIPPLRERPEDIPLLVKYFTQKYARRMQKKIESVSTASMRNLARWHWPGNVRELENLVERAIVLSRTERLEITVPELSEGGISTAPARVDNFDEQDRILRILKETKGRVGGANGAAARLGLKRTTLITRMKKLGIDPRKVL